MRLGLILIGVLCVFFTSTVQEKQLTNSELEEIGIGLALENNLKSDHNFAIVKPPLMGFISVKLLRLYGFDQQVEAFPSVHYGGIISYIYAIELPGNLGKQFIDKIPRDQLETVNLIMRIKNIVAIILIAIMFSRSVLAIWLLLSFALLDQNFFTYTAQITCVLFTLLSFILMSSILLSRSRTKFILLGILCGLTIGTGGVDWLMVHGLAIASTIILNDIQNKQKSRGFKLVWCVDVLCYSIVASVTVWIIYGMHLVEVCKLVSLMGGDTSEVRFNYRIVPFYDTIKQVVFEIIFKDN